MFNAKMKPFLFFCLLTLSLGLHAQTFTYTNGGSVITVSNGVAVETNTIAVPTPALVTSNGQVVPQEMKNEIAADLGIPAVVVGLIPLKLIPWITAFIFLLPYIGRAVHAYATDGGLRGIYNAVVFGTNTPKMQDKTTLAAVAPAAIPAETINPAKV